MILAQSITDKKLETVRVKQKGQVTVPAKVRKRLGIKEGDLLELEAGEDSIILKPKARPEPGRPVGAEEQKKILRSLERLRKNWH